MSVVPSKSRFNKKAIHFFVCRQHGFCGGCDAALACVAHKRLITCLRALSTRIPQVSLLAKIAKLPSRFRAVQKTRPPQASARAAGWGGLRIARDSSGSSRHAGILGCHRVVVGSTRCLVLARGVPVLRRAVELRARARAVMAGAAPRQFLPLGLRPTAPRVAKARGAVRPPHPTQQRVASAVVSQLVGCRGRQLCDRCSISWRHQWL